VRAFWVAAFISAIFVIGASGALSPSASTRIVVRIPEVLMLYVNGQAGGELPVRVENGRVIPDRVEVRVVANTAWSLWVRASELRGPITLPPDRLRLGGRRLSLLPQKLVHGRGPARFAWPLAVDLAPGEPKSGYKAVLTFNLARP